VTSQWLAAKEKLEPGEIGIEYSEDMKSARLLIGNLDGTMDALAFSPISKIVTISLPAESWNGDSSPYSQTFEAGAISGVSEMSKVDLQPSTEQLEIFHEKDLAFVAENEDGIVTVFCIGQKPVNDYVIQATVTEVVVNG
jgi:hypothetical protein